MRVKSVKSAIFCCFLIQKAPLNRSKHPKTIKKRYKNMSIYTIVSL